METGDSSATKGDDEGSEDAGQIWPVAMWSVSEGCWRASTCNNDEIVISDPLDEDGGSGGKSMDQDAARKEKEALTLMGEDVVKATEGAGDDDDRLHGEGRKSVGDGEGDDDDDGGVEFVDCDVDGSSSMMEDDEDADLSQDGLRGNETYHEDHNYSSPPLSSEPLNLCSVVMEDDEPVEGSGESEAVAMVTGEALSEVGAKENPRRREGEDAEGEEEDNDEEELPVVSVVVGSKKVGTIKEFAGFPRAKARPPEVTVKAFSVPSPVFKPKVVNVIRENELISNHKRPPMPSAVMVRDPAGKMEVGRLLRPRNVGRKVHRIIIKNDRNNATVKHIPLVTGSRLSDTVPFPKDTRCSLLKFNNVAR